MSKTQYKNGKDKPIIMDKSMRWVYKDDKTPIFKYRKSSKVKIKTYKDYLTQSKNLHVLGGGVNIKTVSKK